MQIIGMILLSFPLMDASGCMGVVIQLLHLSSCISNAHQYLTQAQCCGSCLGHLFVSLGCLDVHAQQQPVKLYAMPG